MKCLLALVLRYLQRSMSAPLVVPHIERGPVACPRILVLDLLFSSSLGSPVGFITHVFYPQMMEVHVIRVAIPIPVGSEDSRYRLKEL